jgi:hypothetical protein
MPFDEKVARLDNWLASVLNGTNVVIGFRLQRSPTNTHPGHMRAIFDDAVMRFALLVHPWLAWQTVDTHSKRIYDIDCAKDKRRIKFGITTMYSRDALRHTSRFEGSPKVSAVNAFIFDVLDLGCWFMQISTIPNQGFAKAFPHPGRRACRWLAHYTRTDIRLASEMVTRLETTRNEFLAVRAESINRLLLEYVPRDILDLVRTDFPFNTSVL